MLPHKDYNFYISKEHIIFNVSNGIGIFKIEYRPNECKTKYEKIIAEIADKYSLASNLVQEIRNNFIKEFEGFKPFEIVNSRQNLSRHPYLFLPLQNYDMVSSIIDMLFKKK